MSKHTPYTPGPWVAVGFWVEHPDDKRADICTCAPEALGQGHLQRSDTEVVANAKLIAAAPDLLEALKSIWIWMEGQARAQSKGAHETFDLMMLREQRDIAGAAIAKAERGAN